MVVANTPLSLALRGKFMKVINKDSKRLTWLQQQQGCALVSDDEGHWAVVCDGMQNIPLNPPDDVQTTFFIEKGQWRKTIRRAIDATMKEFSS